jgi:hypothetical protein
VTDAERNHESVRRQGNDAASALEPMLALDLVAWHGLPPLPAAAVDAAFGPPESSEDAHLGWYPARRSTYLLDRPCGGLHCYSREDHVVLVETIVAPSSSLIAALGPPSVAKRHEILVDGAYVHEWVYGERGLVLSVAEPFAAPDERRVVRCRGLRPLASDDDLGPEFYLAFEDRTSWAGPQ